MKPIIRAAAYLRVSSENQLKKHDGSLDTQLTLVRGHVEYENLKRKADGKPPIELVEIFRDEGESAKDTDRPEYQRMRASILRGEIDWVIVNKLDRITRSIVDFVDMFREFKERRVQFVSLGENLGTDSPQGQMMIVVLVAFAEMERQLTSARTKQKTQTRRKQGMWFGGKVPVGYRPNPENPTTLLIDEEEAKIVRDVFRLFLEIGSIRGLTKTLALRGVRRPKRVSRRGKRSGGGPLDVNTVSFMLRNSGYVGVRVLDDGVVVKATWEPIIDDETFKRVQDRLEVIGVNKPHGRQAEFVLLFRGLMKCGSCGATMTYASGTGRNKTRSHYYQCSQKKTSVGTRCKMRDAPAERVEELLLSRLRGYSVDEVAVREAVRAANDGRDAALVALRAEREQVERSLADERKRLSRLLDMIESGEGDGDTSGSMMDRVRRREVGVAEMEGAIATIAAKCRDAEARVLSIETVAHAYSSFAALFEAAEKAGARTELRALLQAIVQSVVWHDDPSDSSRCQADMNLFPLPAGLSAPESKQPGDGFAGLSRLAPLRGLVSNASGGTATGSASAPGGDR